MTKNEAVIISAYTSYLLVPFGDVHEYIEKKMGRPVWTHEIGDPEFYEKIREACMSDFLGIKITDFAEAAVERLQAENAKLRAVLSEPNIEILSSKVHDGWWEEKKSQGFHAPNDCKCYDPDDVVHFYWDKFESHCDHCHTDMYPYNELPENIKDYDRVTVKAVLKALAELDKEGER